MENKHWKFPQQYIQYVDDSRTSMKLKWSGRLMKLYKGKDSKMIVSIQAFIMLI